MNRRLTVLALALLLSAGLVFAGGGTESKPAAAKGGTVALMWGGTDAPFVGPHIRSFTATMEKAGYKVVVPDSKWDPAKQSTDMDDMVAQKVDLICLVPVDPVAIIPALKKAKESGVPVMTINTEADKSANQYIVGFSGVGCYEQGLVAADLLLEAMKSKGNIAVVEGVSGFNACVLYAKALDDTIKKKKAAVKILAVQPTNWSPAEATKVTEDYITRFKNMDAIYAHDDYLAGGRDRGPEGGGDQARDRSRSSASAARETRCRPSRTAGCTAPCSSPRSPKASSRPSGPWSTSGPGSSIPSTRSWTTPRSTPAT